MMISRSINSIVIAGLDPAIPWLREAKDAGSSPGMTIQSKAILL